MGRRNKAAASNRARAKESSSPLLSLRVRAVATCGVHALSDELYPDPPKPKDPNPSTLVIYHGHCGDGFSAAWAAWRVFGDCAEYIPAHHGAPPLPDVRGKRVYILDFSYPRELLLTMANQAREIVLLDHHASAAKDLEGLPFATFDQSKSGAILAWEHFHPGQELPLFLHHINDRDLGHWRLQNSAPFLAWLEQVPRTFRNWDRIAGYGPARYHLAVKIGAQFYLSESLEIERLVHAARPATFANLPALVVDCPGGLVCHVGPRLAERAGGLGLCAYEGSDAEVRVSVRSVPKIDASEVARKYGGGGHPQMAGIVLKAEDWRVLMREGRL